MPGPEFLCLGRDTSESVHILQSFMYAVLVLQSILTAEKCACRSHPFIMVVQPGESVLYQ